jgi:hypothetical protein
VLEGSVRSAGERVRVTAQLIDADTGFHLWSQNYDRKFEDLFALQDELAAAIAEALQRFVSRLGLVEYWEHAGPPDTLRAPRWRAGLRLTFR